MFKAGAHVPLIPLLEVVGKAVKVAPEQIGATAVKVGVIVEVRGTHIPPLQLPVAAELSMDHGSVAALNVLTKDQVGLPSCWR